VTRESITLALQDRELDAFDRSLDVHISRLRAKLGNDSASIQTIRGIGYLLANAKESA
jgi:DNA-binding response OmpR family regulator